MDDLSLSSIILSGEFFFHTVYRPDCRNVIINAHQL